MIDIDAPDPAAPIAPFTALVGCPAALSLSPPSQSLSLSLPSHSLTHRALVGFPAALSPPHSLFFYSLCPTFLPSHSLFFSLCLSLSPSHSLSYSLCLPLHAQYLVRP